MKKKFKIIDASSGEKLKLGGIVNKQDWDEYYADEGHQADLHAERKAQLEADGPYDDYEFAEDLEEFWEDE